MRNSFFRIGILPAFLIFIMLVFEPPGISLPSLSAAVIHECGHLAAARLLGIRLRSLDIGPLGATIQTRGYLIPYMHEWLLCAAGPAANFATCAIIYACFSGTAGASGSLFTLKAKHFVIHLKILLSFIRACS